MFDWIKEIYENDVSEEFLDSLVNKEVEYTAWLPKEQKFYSYTAKIVSWNKYSFIADSEELNWFSVQTDEGLEHKLLKDGKFKIIKTE